MGVHIRAGHMKLQQQELKDAVKDLRTQIGRGLKDLQITWLHRKPRVTTSKRRSTITNNKQL